jgi:hypothetical protein
MRRHWKHRPHPKQVTTDRRGRDARERDRNNASRFPFEQQELDRESDRRDRSRKPGRHPGSCAGHEQRFTFRTRQVKKLGDQSHAPSS